MKKILITGENSFVGISVKRYLEQWPEKYAVTAISMRNDIWKKYDFSSFDSVFHVAGLAHSDVSSLSKNIKAKYYDINTNLAVAVAKKAKIEGSKQFIFMSSAIVYGESAPIGTQKIITAETPCAPANFYGDSKVQAENGIRSQEDENFRVVILRCPMIYGKGCKGSFPILEKLANNLPIFPKVNNERSMLYVGNLVEFVRLMIENEENGIFWPCNSELSNTSELVKMIAECYGKRIALIPGFGGALKWLSLISRHINKAFGNLSYKEHLGDYKEDYRLFNLEQSIKETVV